MTRPYTKYDAATIAKAKAAVACGIQTKVVARKLKINTNYLLSGCAPWGDTPPDAIFIDRFNALFES